MDTITHTLFGFALYGSLNKKDMNHSEKRAFLITAIGASQIPDIDIVSKWWDHEGLYQMWHRGITHSIFLTPVWALLFLGIAYLFFRVRNPKLFFLAWIAVVIHNTSDLFNAWGTGYLEPFSNTRITFGTIPIIDFVFWMILGVSFYLSRRNKLRGPFYFRIAWVLIALHITIQSIQGYFLYQQYSDEYDQVALSAGFVPWTFSVITKYDSTVAIYQDNLFMNKKQQYVISSQEGANLDFLFKERPEAKTLYQWSPFVVIVDDDHLLGIYDPRFYRNGQSFLFEYIKKN